MESEVGAERAMAGARMVAKAAIIYETEDPAGHICTLATSGREVEATQKTTVSL